MSSKQSSFALIPSKTGVALAVVMSMGVFALATGLASADPMQYSQGGWRGGERIYGFVSTGSESSAPSACAGRLGGAILGGFANPSDSPRLGQACRY